MSDPTFGVRATTVGEKADVRVVGDLDVATAPELLQRLSDMLSDGIQVMTLDLSELEFVDSSGLSALVRALECQREKGGDVVLKAPSPSTRRVLEITGLLQVFTVIP